LLLKCHKWTIGEIAGIIDYIISHQAEQDHAGSLPELVKAYPESKIVTNERCKAPLVDLLSIPEDRFLIVDMLADILSTLKAEIIEPVVIKGHPKDSDFELLDELAEKISTRHVEIGAAD